MASRPSQHQQHGRIRAAAEHRHHDARQDRADHRDQQGQQQGQQEHAHQVPEMAVGEGPGRRGLIVPS
ncbi:hypothetical protein, partial [Caulobacter sp. B11]|uniref:hypothetical protein n=1 Tax=Caulobacter sp. B11 TaxID=2048899 RepID=UPI001F36A140